MSKVLVVYYSEFGYVAIVAHAIAEGARSAGAVVDTKRVPETVPIATSNGAYFNPVRDDPPYPPLRITEDYVQALEADCDAHNAGLPALRSFILPSGSPGAALLHLARTIVRRAERSTWAALESYGDSMNPLTARYLNRLSDLLFILAREANGPDGDVLWKPGGER